MVTMPAAGTWSNKIGTPKARRTQHSCSEHNYLVLSAINSPKHHLESSGFM